MATNNNAYKTKQNKKINNNDDDRWGHINRIVYGEKNTASI